MRIHRYEPLPESRGHRKVIGMVNVTVIYTFIFSLCALTTVLIFRTYWAPTCILPKPRVICEPACPPNWFQFGGNCYYFSIGRTIWSSAQRYCHTYNSRLVTLPSLTEKVFASKFLNGTSHWIGMDNISRWRYRYRYHLVLRSRVRRVPFCPFMDEDGEIEDDNCFANKHWICQADIGTVKLL
ncbi:b168.5 [Murid betaherpesvirus 8]|uniref:B168.5 n=1 Tax=Rat cytomegalovirus (isolate England) TaxID=1261657 RepID=K7XR73_RCMVE|nr:e168.5 [Murid betaherpesvirus 8]AFX83466.1 e168.5 [Murid betaherpesvirus 8]AKB93345.1 b168.5 [Murid betaherpesvirus 8]WEG71938.1 protein e168 [Murid betaherpesvirus 8]WPH25059.1 b168.5 [Murid betaherpesvirus 8]WPH25193.1 b168.5 [Murid betaherpesvirus 8]